MEMRVLNLELGEGVRGEYDQNTLSGILKN